ncbi:MAG TPA: hypothetical protein VMD59_14615, partial [Acidimicrobiales bacterium]|nr:hypothetical protein [Acidimicrobiales bacterium]
MTISTTYPGVYVQELPSLVHNVLPAPTSIAVFVGYSNPYFPNAPFNKAIQLFSFADYQAQYGGFFYAWWLPDYLGWAVNQFFLNGGTTCYVVALQTSQAPQASASANLSASGDTISFSALQPVDDRSGSSLQGLPMSVKISNLTTTTVTDDTADYVVTYGPAPNSTYAVVETYRQVTLANLASPTTNPLLASKLVSVTVNPNPPTGLGLDLGASSATLALTYGTEPTTSGAISASDFTTVFQDYQPLDTVPVFNILAVPGMDYFNTANSGLISQAIAFCERKRAMFVIDTPSSSDTTDHFDAKDLVQNTSNITSMPTSINAAVYYPWLQITHP